MPKHERNQLASVNLLMSLDSMLDTIGAYVPKNLQQRVVKYLT